MVDAAAFRQLPPAQRAELLYQQARADMARSLWNAAIGTGDGAGGRGAADGARAAARPAETLDLASLLALLTEPQGAAIAPSGAPPQVIRGDPRSPPPWAEADGRARGDGQGRAPAQSAGLGPNAVYRATLAAAAARTGIPAEALAAIVNAEAAQASDGSWLRYSRNPRSSAAGLGQFLSGTWKGEAEQPGTWLNAYAQAQGWLNARGHVRSDAKSDLLALRYDPRASIETIADYARTNVAKMRDAGIAIGQDATAIAKAAYLAHHLGLGDAIRFAKRGLDSGRAEYLLAAQIGAAAANQRILACGDATQAHRTWLLDYVARQFKPSRFSADFSA
jgi:hypothetical protein